MVCTAERGGQIREHKGVFLPSIATALPSLTEKDRQDAADALRGGADFIALSFVRRAEDMEELRAITREAAHPPMLVAKIEKPQALENLPQIVAVSDVVMVARGDLGVEVDIHRIGVLQKEIIQQCRQQRTPVIVATQMLESMTERPSPTRAEATDVTNAILDGTDAVMLSGETATGRYPFEAVSTMRRIAEATESYMRRTSRPMEGTPPGFPPGTRSSPSPTPASPPPATPRPGPSSSTPSPDGPPACCPGTIRPARCWRSRHPRPPWRQMNILFGVYPQRIARYRSSDQLVRHSEERVRRLIPDRPPDLLRHPVRAGLHAGGHQHPADPGAPAPPRGHRETGPTFRRGFDMRCGLCGFENESAGKFCGSCGAPLPGGADPGFCLVSAADSGQPARTPLHKAVFYIGRSHECDLVVPHASISRQHALISCQDGAFYLEDLRSKNGVLLNHHRVQERVEIKAGDEIQFGDIVFILEGPGPAEAAAAPANERHQPVSNFEMLLEASKLINSSLILPEVLDKVMSSVMDLTRAQRGFLMIAGENGQLEIKVARNIEETAFTSQQFQISRSSVERVFKSGQSFISVDIDSDSQVSAQQSIMSLGLKTVLCVPLKHKGTVRGVIYVDSHNVTKGFSDGDRQLMEALADHAAIAIENARLVEENNEMFFSTIEALAEAIEKRDPYTGGHTRRVLEISLDIAGEMSLGPQEREILKLAALLHDIGKIGIDDQVLRKQAALTTQEFEPDQKASRNWL